MAYRNPFGIETTPRILLWSAPLGKPLLKSLIVPLLSSFNHIPELPYINVLQFHFIVPRSNPLFHRSYRYSAGRSFRLMFTSANKPALLRTIPEKQKSMINGAKTIPNHLWCCLHVDFFIRCPFPFIWFSFVAYSSTKDKHPTK